MNDQRMVDVVSLTRYAELCEKGHGATVAQEIRGLLDGPGVEPVAWSHWVRLGGRLFMQWPIAGTKEDAEKDLLMYSDGDRRGAVVRPLYLATPSAPAQAIEITDEMAYAFHRAIDDSPLGNSDVKDIKAGLRAAFANVVAPVQAVPDWQPIETAPKDGSDVLLYDGKVTVGAWCENTRPWNDGSWWIDGGQVTGTPTHWMPLPQPPKEIGE